MKNEKVSKSLRLIAFFLVAVILICAFGFSADGWHFLNNSVVDTPSTEEEKNGTTDESVNISLPENKDDEVAEEKPKFYNRLTGEETTEELSKTRHTAFVLSSTSPMYGVSYSDILIEFPIENGETRLLSFINSPLSIAKIGSLAETRGYITNLSKAFDTPIFSSGVDDTIDYPSCSAEDKFTIRDTVSEFIYTEFSRFTYTGADLLAKALLTKSEDPETPKKQIPFIFNTEELTIKGETYFSKILIPYSASDTTSLTYIPENSTYTFEKNNLKITDLINKTNVHFKNCFILFADSATYENQNSTQMILNTIGEGSGYYFTEGTAKQIKWSLSNEGDMKFYDENSNELIINVGTSYISFVKSSKIEDIVLS